MDLNKCKTLKSDFAEYQLLRNYPPQKQGLCFCTRKFPFHDELFEALTPVLLVVCVPLIIIVIIVITKRTCFKALLD